MNNLKKLVAALALAASTSAFADVTYTFSGDDYSFVLTTADFINSDTSFDASALTNASSNISTVLFYTNTLAAGITSHADWADIRVISGSTEHDYYFSALALITEGVFNGTSEVGGSLAVAAVPEPSGWAMLVAGLLGISAIGSKRRKNAVPA